MVKLDVSVLGLMKGRKSWKDVIGPEGRNERWCLR